MKRTILFALSILSYQQSLLSWYDFGHMLVASIAYEQLTPATKKAVNTILIQSHRLLEVNDTFISAAVWPDAIRRENNMRMFDSWHTASLPYDPDHLLSGDKKMIFAASWESRNAVWAIDECIKILQNPNSSTWQKGFSLRFLIHIVGDIHQPLHCCTLFNKDFPHGDRAGTWFQLRDPLYKNLHALWDCIVGLCGERLHVPLKAAEGRLISNATHELMSKFPLTTFAQRDDMLPTSWQQESYQLALEYAYSGIKPGEKPSAEYIARGRPVAEQRIVLAGYRLAKVLNALFEPTLDKTI